VNRADRARPFVWPRPDTFQIDSGNAYFDSVVATTVCRGHTTVFPLTKTRGIEVRSSRMRSLDHFLFYEGALDVDAVWSPLQ
jgi:hypothetical protein